MGGVRVYRYQFPLRRGASAVETDAEADILPAAGNNKEDRPFRRKTAPVLPEGEPIAQPSESLLGEENESGGVPDPREESLPLERRRQARERPAPKKPLSKGARLFLLVFTLVCMVAITAFLCVFLLFKVRTIEVTGDVVYEQSAILEVCDLRGGR